MADLTLFRFARSMTQPEKLPELLATPPLRIVSGDRWRLECLYLDPPFQIERAIVDPFSYVSMHRHPHADTFEYYLSGEGELTVGGHLFITGSQMSQHRRLIPIGHLAWHGAKIGADPSVFLSIQQWIGKSEIMPVTDDWEAEIVKEGVARSIPA